MDVSPRRLSSGNGRGLTYASSSSESASARPTTPGSPAHSLLGIATRDEKPKVSRAPELVLRFTRSERAFHWLVAGAFFVLLITGVLMGHRGTFHDVMYAGHLTSMGLLVIGLALITVRGDRRALSQSRRELSRLDALDREWLARVPASVFRHSPETPAGRFNAGQKLNFMLVSVFLAALFVSGIGLLITGSHPVNPAFKAAHVAAAYLAFVLVLGHLYMALVNPSTRPALRGMISGKVDAAWVRKHHERPSRTTSPGLSTTPPTRSDAQP
jgi:formate dehydrogenase subunit gamma